MICAIFGSSSDFEGLYIFLLSLSMAGEVIKAYSALMAIEGV